MKPILFNHGIFQKEINDKIRELHDLRTKESDPYKQWNYSENIKLLEELLVRYKKSVDIQYNR